MELRHCERSEAIQGRHTHSLDRFVASLLAMTPYHQVMILSTRGADLTFATHRAAGSRSFPGSVAGQTTPQPCEGALSFSLRQRCLKHHLVRGFIFALSLQVNFQQSH